MNQNYLLKCLNLFNLLSLIVSFLLLILLFNYIFTILFFSSGDGGLILFSLVPVKAKSSLSKSEREKIVLTPQLKEILVGLLLGDVSARRPKPSVNTRLQFAQSVIHEDYILHLYELFKDYCKAVPKIITPMAHKKTGKVYPYIKFEARTLPCFNYYYDIFHHAGVKVVPTNIAELLTPLSLAYWICDDGNLHKRDRVIFLCTNGFTLEGVNLLINVLTNKFGIDCALERQRGQFIIRIPRRNLPVVQALLKDIMPPMMLHKIGL